MREYPKDYSSQNRCQGALGRIRRALAFIFLLTAVGLSAEEVSPTRELTFELAILKSLRSHPELSGYEYQLQATDALAAQAGVGARPELGIEVEDVAGTGDFSEVESAQTTLAISWILQSDLIDKRMRAARSQASVIETRRQILELEVAANTARYFLQGLAQQERLGLAVDSAQQAREALADIRRQVAAGKVPQADASRAEAELERRLLAVGDVEHELEIAKYRIAAQWGDRAPAFTGLYGALTASVPPIDIAQLRAQVAGNPNLALLLRRERVAEAEIALARAEAGIQWRIDAGIRRLEATDDYSLVAGVAMPIGGRNRNRNQVTALRAQQEQYRAERSAKAIEMETRVYVMAEQLLHSRHVAEALAEKIIPSLERSLADTRNAYQKGKYSFYELAAAQQDLIDAKLSFLEAQFQAHLYLIEIEKLTGLSLLPVSENEK